MASCEILLLERRTRCFFCDSGDQVGKAQDVSLSRQEQSRGEILEAMACETLISERFSIF